MVNFAPSFEPLTVSMKRFFSLRKLPFDTIKKENRRDYFPYNTDPAQMDLYALRNYTEKEIGEHEEEHQEEFEVA
jgi:hypothetical protein